MKTKDIVLGTVVCVGLLVARFAIPPYHATGIPVAEPEHPDAGRPYVNIVVSPATGTQVNGLTIHW